MIEFKKRSSDFKIKLGTKFIDSKRKIIITDCDKRTNIKGRMYKYYKYTCLICGWTDGWMEESNLIHGYGCSCCHSFTVVEGINDIPTTAPWMVKYFQGGFDEAKLYTYGSNKKIYPICPDCGRVKDNPISISNIFNKKFGCICSDNISYPEKFFINFIKQLNINYIYQYSKTNDKWCEKYRYDFKINNCIIELHGIQHYESSSRGRLLSEEQENDKMKEQLAKENGIKHYIVLDCRKSELEWIKRSVMESELPTLFNFIEEDIDWLKCEKFATSNLIKQVCEYQNFNQNLTTTEIGKVFSLDRHTIYRYLNNGNKIGWCNYIKYTK